VSDNFVHHFSNFFDRLNQDAWVWDHLYKYGGRQGIFRLGLMKQKSGLVNFTLQLLRRAEEFEMARNKMCCFGAARVAYQRPRIATRVN
jgi:hypothetical protein